MPEQSLTDFLEARIVGDEVVAWSAENRIFPTTWREDVATLRNEHVRQHVDRYNPARVLAECKTKRQALTEYDKAFAQRKQLANTPHAVEGSVRLLTALRFVKLLALPYADHPDYNETWRPE